MRNIEHSFVYTMTMKRMNMKKKYFGLVLILALINFAVIYIIKYINRPQSIPVFVRKQFIYFDGSISNPQSMDKLKNRNMNNKYERLLQREKQFVSEYETTWYMNGIDESPVLYIFVALKDDVRFSCYDKSHEVRTNHLEWNLCANETLRLKSMQESTFSLILTPLDTNVTYTPLLHTRLIESLQAGSIPVILGSNIVLPYQEIIQWDKVVIRHPKKHPSLIIDHLVYLPYDDRMAYQLNVNSTFKNFFASEDKHLKAAIAIEQRKHNLETMPKTYRPIPTRLYHKIHEGATAFYASSSNKKLQTIKDTNNKDDILDSKDEVSLNIPKGVCTNRANAAMESSQGENSHIDSRFLTFRIY